MQVIRQIVTVKNGQISLRLPEEFDAQEVEVIVLSKNEYEVPDDFGLSDEKKQFWMSA